MAVGGSWRVENATVDSDEAPLSMHVISQMNSENLEDSCDQVDFPSAAFKDQMYTLSISTSGNEYDMGAQQGKIQKLLSSDQSISILFAGKTGAGKSSLINALIGRNIAKEGASPKPVTALSALDNPYTGEFMRTEGSKVRIIVWDSPGLQDGYERDANYLKRLTDVLDRVDLVVYCISMRERFDVSSQQALRGFVEVKPTFWNNVVFALTHANHIMYPESCQTEEDEFIFFDSVVQEWAKEIGTVLRSGNVPLSTIESIPLVPTGYHRVTRNTPHPWRLHSRCNHWLQPFWYVCLTRCHETARAALVMSNKHRFSTCEAFNFSEFEKKPIECQPLICDTVFSEDISNGTYLIGGGRAVLSKIWTYIRSLLPFLKKTDH